MAYPLETMTTHSVNMGKDEKNQSYWHDEDISSWHQVVIILKA